MPLGKGAFLFWAHRRCADLQSTAHARRSGHAYETLLDEFQKRTQRIVLLSPTPFQKSSPHFPDLTARNSDLKLYADAVRKLAEKRGLLFVDLMMPVLETPPAHPLTRDGVH